MPKTATATATANSKLLEAAVKLRVVDVQAARNGLTIK